MENIEKSKCQNATGISKMFIAEIDEIFGVNLTNRGRAAVSFVPAHNWAIIGADNIDAITEYSDRKYITTIKAEFNTPSAQYLPTFARMTKSRFVVKLIDRNGIEWLYGDKHQPFRLEYTKSNEKGIKNGYTLTFTAETNTPPFEM